MAYVRIPPLTRDLTLGKAVVQVPGRTVGGLIDGLESRFPEVKGWLIVDGDLRPGFIAAVDGTVAHRGLLQRVEDQSEVHFVPSISGGARHLGCRDGWRTRCPPEKKAAATKHTNTPRVS